MASTLTASVGFRSSQVDLRDIVETRHRIANVEYQMATDASDRIRGERMVKAARLEPAEFRAAREQIQREYEDAILHAMLILDAAGQHSVLATSRQPAE